MKITLLATDDAILDELGRRLGAYRLQRPWTQAQLAEVAGVSKRTVERLESGQSVQLSNLLRVLRALDKLDALDRFLPPLPANPIDLLERQGKTRHRARPDTAPSEAASAFRWGDET